MENVIFPIRRMTFSPRVCAYVSRFLIPRGENPAREFLALPHLCPPYPRWVAAPATTTRRPRQDFGCEHPFPCGLAPGGCLVGEIWIQPEFGEIWIQPERENQFQCIA
jgi:hypothetical protein